MFLFYLSNTKIVCVYPIYSQETGFTDDLPVESKKEGEQDWWIWKSSSDTQISSISGLISNYDGSGYIYDLDSYSFVDKEVDDLEARNLID